MDIDKRLMKPFRFWTQKILPLVYDDSLSYYEVLAKVVAKLNDVIDNENKLTIDMQNLYTAFDEYKQEINTKFDDFTTTIDEKIEALETFMNNYFDSLNLTEEVNTILNGYIADGTLSNLIRSIIGSDAYPQFVDNKAQMTNRQRAYVLTTDGFIYYWDGTDFVNSGIPYSSAAGAFKSSKQLISAQTIETLGYNSINDVPQNQIYAIVGNGTDFITDMPDNRFNAVLCDFAFSEVSTTGRMQIFTNRYQSWFRIKWGTDWTSWVSFSPSSEIYITPSNYQRYSDYKTLPSNNAYGINKNVTKEMVDDLPVYGYDGTLYKVNLDANPETQFNGEMLFYMTFDKLYFKHHFGVTYGPWVDVFSVWPNAITDNTVGFNSFDDFKNGIFILNLTSQKVILDCPPQSANGFNGVLISYNTGEYAGYQTYNDIRGGGVRSYHRTKWNGVWSEWYAPKSNAFVLATNENVAGYQLPNNVDELWQNAIYAISTSITSEGLAGLPRYGASSILTVETCNYADRNGIIQKLYSYTNNSNSVYIRFKVGATWTGWLNIGNNGYNAFSNAAIELLGLPNDANEYTQNATIAVSNAITKDGIANLPEYGCYGTLYVVSWSRIAANAVLQFYMNNRGNWWVRMKYGQNWFAWMGCHTNGDSYFVGDCLFKPIMFNDTNKKVIGIGDSIMAGYNVGVSNSWFNILCNKTGWRFENRAVNASAFGKDGYLKILTQLQGVTNWDEVSHVFIAGGTNDSSSDIDSTLFKDRVQEVITYIKERNTSTKIIFLTPIQKASGVQDTARYSGMLCNLALLNECSVINGFNIPVAAYTNEFFTALLSDGVHPTAIGQKVIANYVYNMIE